MCLYQCTLITHITYTSLNIRLLILLVIFGPFVQYDSRCQSGPRSLEMEEILFYIHQLCYNIQQKVFVQGTEQGEIANTRRQQG